MSENNFNQQEFNRFIVENGAMGFFDNPITLKSGRKSNWYINWRNIAEDAFLIDRLSDYVIKFLSALLQNQRIESPDCIYGVPEGATKIGILSQMRWAKMQKNFGPASHCLPMGRGKPKEHGQPKDKYFVGIPRGNVLIIEDVTTTGGSLLQTIDSLSESEINIVGAIGLSNRMELRDDGKTVEQAVAEKLSQGKPIPYFSMSSADQLLPLAIAMLNPKPELIEAVRKEMV